ncbi:probable inactive receptor kinase At5g67200 [Actinidia eriantha]|uniref:probable inactive receptor kinase At5g67200 n=1 Tax=Actinidia eriantha TaxID=165200 RepID=UPI002587A322|nr:probable inactive receptor kinase At5g67200 [Actinidia eriantha]
MSTAWLQNALLLLLSLYNSVHAASLSNSSSANLLQPQDALALLAFKSKADLGNKLGFSPKTSFGFCKWEGVLCVKGRVVRVVMEGLSLGGVFGPDSLTRLDQLRVLSLQNNSLTGPIPDLSPLSNLKSLFLDHNSFAGSIPPSLSTLHRLRTLDLSRNHLTGPIPKSFIDLSRLNYLRLDSNWLNGSVPPLNQSSLQIFNVSSNNLTGAVPVTPTLLRFNTSSFSWNPGLCGKIVNKECSSTVQFFGPSAAGEAPPPSPVALGLNEQVQDVELTHQSPKNHKRTFVIAGFSSGVLVLLASVLCVAVAMRRRRSRKVATPTIPSDVATVMRIEEENDELEEKVKRVQGIQVAKSGNLVFCAGEAQVYTLDQLLRASAELLGRGTLGITYKAVLDNRLIVSVKRLDAVKLGGTGKEVFERHMESVGALRHPNLVPLRAYFQAKDERLLIYDYQPNGSLFSLIHGSKSTRAKPLHWTSCLKIAEDVAQGLSYIHQAWRLVHGNLKSSNVLLGSDFEACLTDYCLSLLISIDPNSDTHIAPEARDPNHQPASKSDVYSFGILLIELLTGKPPCLTPGDLFDWVRSAREDEGGEDPQLEMLIEVAMACSAASPEQRPTMWQVLKMIQEIKEAIVVEDGEYDPVIGTS